MATIENIFDEVQNLNAKIDALPGFMEIHGNQVKIISLDEMSDDMGLLKAGEFRSGNGVVPGDGFSGVRISYPPMSYPASDTSDSARWNIAGVDQDTIQFGLRASDGAAIAGGGAVSLDYTGLTIHQGQSYAEAIKWIDPTGWAGQSATDTNTWLASIEAFNDNPGGNEDIDVRFRSYGRMNKNVDTSAISSSDLPQADMLIEAVTSGNLFDPYAPTDVEIWLDANNDTFYNPTPFRISAKRTYGDCSTGGLFQTDPRDYNIDIMTFSLESRTSDTHTPVIQIGRTSTDPYTSIEIFGDDWNAPYITMDGTNRKWLFGGSDSDAADVIIDSAGYEGALPGITGIGSTNADLYLAGNDTTAPFVWDAGDSHFQFKSIGDTIGYIAMRISQRSGDHDVTGFIQFTDDLGPGEMSVGVETHASDTTIAEFTLWDGRNPLVAGNKVGAWSQEGIDLQESTATAPPTGYGRLTVSAGNLFFVSSDGTFQLNTT